MVANDANLSKKATLEGLYVCLKEIDLAIQALEKLQRIAAKGPASTVVRQIPSRVA